MPNLQSNVGLTALMAATREGHTEIVKMLLAAGADVFLKDQVKFVLSYVGQGSLQPQCHKYILLARTLTLFADL